METWEKIIYWAIFVVVVIGLSYVIAIGIFKLIT
jgi:hypothetical protein